MLWQPINYVTSFLQDYLLPGWQSGKGEIQSNYPAYEKVTERLQVCQFLLKDYHHANEIVTRVTKSLAAFNHLGNKQHIFKWSMVNINIKVIILKCS